MNRKQKWRGNQLWNLEAESIRSRAESTGGCVELETVTEIRWSSACNTLVAQSVYLVLNSLLVWEPVDRLKRGVMCSDSIWYNTSTTFLIYVYFIYL